MFDLTKTIQRQDSITSFERMFLNEVFVNMNSDFFEKLESDYGLRTQSWMFTVGGDIIERNEDFQRVLNGRSSARVTFRFGNPAMDARLTQMLQQLHAWQHGEYDQDEF